MGLLIQSDSNKIKDALLYTPPSIQMKNSFVPKGSGTWRIKDPIYSQNAAIKKWVIICDERDVSIAEKVCLSMLKASKAINVKVAQPNILTIKVNDKRAGPEAA